MVSSRLSVHRAEERLHRFCFVTNRTRNFHNFGLERPEFFDDLFLRLVNPEPPRSRLLYRIHTPDGRHYWIPTRGR